MYNRRQKRGFMENYQLDLFNDSNVLITRPVFQYKLANDTFKENIWEKLGKYTIGDALEVWLSTLSENTSKAYRFSMRSLEKRGYFSLQTSLQSLALIDHSSIVDRIKLDNSAKTEATKQAQAACYISFTTFLCRRFNGMIKRAMPSTEESTKTFFKIRDKVKTNALTQAQWLEFFKELVKINTRDCLIAKIILQGGKRINEVLSLTIDKIDWGKREIHFVQTKAKKMYKETVITYPETIMKELKEYVGEREGLVFLTKRNKKISYRQFINTFSRAGRRANIPFKVTPHVLRASAVTYLTQQGFSDTEIMKVTGHSSAVVLHSYDKTDRAQNASKKVNLIF